MSLTPAEPAIFRGVIALELRDGTPPQHAALAAEAAGDLVAMLGRDLATLVPGVRDCDLALLAAHFDPAATTRRFRIAATDYGSLAVLNRAAPALLRSVNAGNAARQ